MNPADLTLVEVWLDQPHVARWYLAGSTVASELDELWACIRGEEPTDALTVLNNEQPIGWCQWYLCAHYPEHAAAIGAQPGDVGIDYAIGDPDWTHRGVGTALVAALIDHVHRRHPDAGVIADPEAANVASRRVLENNRFRLIEERPVATEPTSSPMAIYRLDHRLSPWKNPHTEA